MRTMYTCGNGSRTGNFFNDFDKVMNDIFADNPFMNDFGLGGRYPAVDIREDDEGYTLEAELAGLSEKDVTVKVTDGVLTISGGTEVKREGYLVKERRLSPFTRSFALPKDADESKIVATFRNGLLTLAVSKLEKALPKDIEIKVE